MTTAQRVHLMADLWPGACRCQGWQAKDRRLRLRVLSEAVGRPLSSANDLDSTSDYDRVKAHLGMLSDNIAATIETDHPEIARARRLRDLRPFYGHTEALLARLVHDKFGRCLTLDDLTADPIIRTDRRTGELRESASQLDQMVFTLSRLLNSKRKAARKERGREGASAGDSENEPF